MAEARVMCGSWVRLEARERSVGSACDFVVYDRDELGDDVSCGYRPIIKVEVVVVDGLSGECC